MLMQAARRNQHQMVSRTAMIQASLRQSSIGSTSHRSLLPQPKFGIKTKPERDDQFEHVDDLFAQMNRQMSDIEKDAGSVLKPRVVAQKEDVLFIKNPDSAWSFNKILRFNSGSELVQNALTISLQENLVIALLLERAANRGMTSLPTIS